MRGILLALLLIGCGSPETSTPMGGGISTATATAGGAFVPPAEDLPLKGAIVSAFQMTVDGASYPDSEAFYTKELPRLRAEADKKGFKGYALTFDAQIGLDDMKNGMSVYVAAAGGQGFAGQTIVDGQGQFQLMVPPKDQKETFQLRAAKRINLVLTSADGKDVHKLCYIFSGTTQQATLAESVLVNTFTTEVTSYACEVDEGGLAIPQNVTPSPSATGTSTGT